MKSIYVLLGAALLLKTYGVILPITHPDRVRVEAAASDLATAMELEGVSDVKVGKAAFVWSWYEAGLWADPRGDNDKGSACGVGQVHVASMPKGLLHPSWTCAALRADRVLGYRAQLRVILHLRTQCGGDLRGALTAYSTTGTCPKPGWTIRLVKARCETAGC